MIFRLFKFCTDFLNVLARVFHTNYLRISVWVNIYFQGLVLFLASLAFVVVTIIRGCSSDLTLKYQIWLIIAILQIIVAVYAIWRYKPPLEPAFYKCYSDLMRLSRRIRISYTMLNILIFVVIYLILIIFDIILLIN